MKDFGVVSPWFVLEHHTQNLSIKNFYRKYLAMSMWY
jgi:hypothetical protein